MDFMFLVPHYWGIFLIFLVSAFKKLFVVITVPELCKNIRLSIRIKLGLYFGDYPIIQVRNCTVLYICPVRGDKVLIFLKKELRLEAPPIN